MSKKGFNFTFCIILLFVFLMTASAHPGRTDKNGGHYNRSTGEYHYHSGEYAGRSQSSSSSSTKKKTTKETESSKPKKEASSQKKKKTTFWDVAKIILAVHLAFFPITIWFYTSIYEAIVKLFKKIFSKK